MNEDSHKVIKTVDDNGNKLGRNLSFASSSPFVFCGGGIFLFMYSFRLFSLGLDLSWMEGGSFFVLLCFNLMGSLLW